MLRQNSYDPIQTSTTSYCLHESWLGVGVRLLIYLITGSNNQPEGLIADGQLLLDSVHTAGIASSKVQNVRSEEENNRRPRYLTNKTQLLKVELLGRARCTGIESWSGSRSSCPRIPPGIRLCRLHAICRSRSGLSSGWRIAKHKEQISQTIVCRKSIHVIGNLSGWCDSNTV